MVFNGSVTSEIIDLSANGGRLRLTRNLGSVVMDTDDVEQINVNAFNGNDTITVNDLSGTDVTAVKLNLESTPGSGSGDLLADTVTVNGTAGPINIQIHGQRAAVSPSSASRTSGHRGRLRRGERLAHRQRARRQRHDQRVWPRRLASSSSSRSMAAMATTCITGSDGNDMLLGGDGDDLIIGGRGSDTALMGDGNDTFVWNPGDGSDIVEGQGGIDTMVFNGANVDEKFDLSANGSRLRLTRDVGSITMDTNGLERINLNTLGGADTVTVNDLTGTGLATLNLNLAAATRWR